MKVIYAANVADSELASGNEQVDKVRHTHRERPPHSCSSLTDSRGDDRRRALSDGGRGGSV